MAQLAPRVLARDAVASLKRWARRDVYAISVFAQVDELSAISDNVLQFRLKRPFRLLADLLGKPNPFAPVVMPERLALTEPGQQVKEIIGSGPYKFVMSERVPGSLAVYERNADYVPRTDGPPVGTAGPKIAYFDRVEWHTIPDAGTAAAALQSGEMDWWEQATSDLLPLLRKTPGCDGRCDRHARLLRRAALQPSVSAVQQRRYPPRPARRVQPDRHDDRGGRRRPLDVDARASAFSRPPRRSPTTRAWRC